MSNDRNIFARDPLYLTNVRFNVLEWREDRHTGQWFACQARYMEVFFKAFFKAFFVVCLYPSLLRWPKLQVEAQDFENGKKFTSFPS